MGRYIVSPRDPASASRLVCRVILGSGLSPGESVRCRIPGGRWKPLQAVSVALSWT